MHSLGRNVVAIILDSTLVTQKRLDPTSSIVCVEVEVVQVGVDVKRSRSCGGTDGVCNVTVSSGD